MSLFWFELLKDVVPHHVVSADVSDYPDELKRFRDQLEGRSMLVQKTDLLPIECVVRGYIVGLGLEGLQEDGCRLRHRTTCGAAGVRPARAADLHAGHQGGDGPRREHLVRDDDRDRRARTARRKHVGVSLEIYERARAHAEARGIIVADTKFEFGIRDGRLIWIDEALTPDSSRFWPRDAYAPGRSQPSFDKQFVRDYLETLDWDKQPPGPELPPEVVARTVEKYVEAFERLRGEAR